MLLALFSDVAFENFNCAFLVDRVLHNGRPFMAPPFSLRGLGRRNVAEKLSATLELQFKQNKRFYCSVAALQLFIRFKFDRKGPSSRFESLYGDGTLSSMVVRLDYVTF
ncbi:hypothetical protein GWI33_018941 [Rhynchophorus ferrugineus]|uniref:Uncharacterized protein n=1 Tax=Rhynchophorus ferrugineus TaxID=354439 RepID=A0A834HVD6_RHYFE|nr:hypothetical protein GWI33_018941 [Rhynchophorus ferrugineus]